MINAKLNKDGQIYFESKIASCLILKQDKFEFLSVYSCVEIRFYKYCSYI